MSRAPIDKRTARLVREAMVLGYANGAWDGHAKARGGQDLPDDYPKDSEVVAGVLRSARSSKDLYPTLGRLAERLAMEVDES